MKKILGLGNALVDVLVQVPDENVLDELHLPKGSMQLIDAVRYRQVRKCLAPISKQRTTGGSACNTILAISHFGNPTGLIGKIGNDEAAGFFSSSFRRQGVSAHLLAHKDLPTGVASTIITPDGQRTFGTYLGAAATLSADDIKEEWFDGYDYFYVEGYLVQNHALISHTVQIAHKHGLKICLDLASYNIVQSERDFFHELLPQADILFANEQEAAAFTGSGSIQHNIEELASLCHTAVVKVGKDGVYVRCGTESVHCPARDVPCVVDTTAAGDYFSAGFLAAHSRGRGLMECAQLGSLLAGHIIEVVGTALSDTVWKKILKSL